MNVNSLSLCIETNVNTVNKATAYGKYKNYMSNFNVVHANMLYSI